MELNIASVFVAEAKVGLTAELCSQVGGKWGKIFVGKFCTGLKD
ncbi:MAG TPA: hypothetical protein PKJ63_02070 [Cyclobacteriaceae bacterium]|nr:hypothetical protein [Cyclobacteriaceae bacterium]